jgi:hypothetical protein
MWLLILTIFSVLFAEWYASYDFKKFAQGDYPNHFESAIIRFTILSIASCWGCWMNEHELSFFDCILYLSYSCAVFYLVFEWRFNLLFCDGDPFYIGNTAWTDKMLRRLRIRGIQLFCFKIALIINLLSIILFKKELIIFCNYMIKH